MSILVNNTGEQPTMGGTCRPSMVSKQEGMVIYWIQSFVILIADTGHIFSAHWVHLDQNPGRQSVFQIFKSIGQVSVCGWKTIHQNP